MTISEKEREVLELIPRNGDWTPRDEKFDFWRSSLGFTKLSKKGIIEFTWIDGVQHVKRVKLIYKLRSEKANQTKDQ